MNRDIDQIIERVKERIGRAGGPAGHSHPGTEEDVLWFFRMPGTSNEVAVDSPTGNAPFQIEHDDMRANAEAETVSTVEEAVEKVAAYLTGQPASGDAATRMA